jgi:hypothetical protein
VNEAPDHDICDVKLHQFASFSASDSLVLIDSDMIYSKNFVAKALQAVHSCKSNQECDFFDCKGICTHEQEQDEDGRSICVPDHQDSNLNRVCRNILFPFTFHLFETRISLLGIFSDYFFHFREEISEIMRLCESSSREKMLQNANAMLKIMEKIQMNI